MGAAPSPEPFLTILIVDDEPAIRDYLTMLLEEEGFRVVLASDGARALEVAARERPELILSDICMPVLDGLGLLAAVRRHRTLARTPMLLMSADSDGMPAAEGVPVIAKPFDIDQVVTLIRAGLAGGAERTSA